MTPKELKSLRNELGLSVSKAANQVHVTTRTWNRYEAGDRAIPDAIVELFCIKNKLEYPLK